MSDQYRAQDIGTFGWINLCQTIQSAWVLVANTTHLKSHELLSYNIPVRVPKGLPFVNFLNIPAQNPILI